MYGFIIVQTLLKRKFCNSAKLKKGTWNLTLCVFNQIQLDPLVSKVMYISELYTQIVMSLLAQYCHIYKQINCILKRENESHNATEYTLH
jgi:hypothetical protein